MADEQPPPVLAAFPSPPPFWQQFTPENIERISSLRTAQSESSSKSADPALSLPVRILDLPPELRNLQPPEPPEDGIYRCFGELLRLDDPIVSLKDLGFTQLYTPPETPSSGDLQNRRHNDRALILKRIAKSLILNFGELMGILCINPSQYLEKAADIKTLFMNFHHLLNEYRPHQARESLILMMQDQLERSRRETQGIKGMKEKVESILEGLSQVKLVDTNGLSEKEVPKEEESVVWDVLEREFG